MCGIAGFCDPRRRAAQAELERAAAGMAAALRHRGPDDQGTWADADAGVALAHSRLAILDLSQEGHQPMHSANGRFVLVFNGEIYNFQSLRRELEDCGHTFRGHSDTEVLLAAFCAWGIGKTVQRCIGMFAIAVWDRQSRKLHLVRDRAGEKPLYYGWTGDVFVFGSELKALRAHPRWRAAISRPAVALLTRYGYIPAPFSIYQNIYKLNPGCVLTLTEAQLQARNAGRPYSYWSLRQAAREGFARPFAGKESEATERLRSLLLDSVRQQMVADVPLGAFLSGGIDSSLVVALMQAQSRRPVKTFSIGFRQNGFDEAPFARAVARHLGTDHTELYVEPGELRQVIARLPAIYDEPFADSSQIPTVVLCELARSQVTVSLSGDAGDELFGGYGAYRKAQRIWSVLGRIPLSLRGGMARALRSAAACGLDLRRRRGSVPHYLGRLANFAELLPMHSDRSLYQLLMSPNRDPLAWLRYKAEPLTKFDDAPPWEDFPDLLRRMMCLDFVTYLPDDILAKVDRAAMAVSLETRIPLLDHRVIEFAWSLPNALKQRRGRGKYLLRRVLHQYVPADLVERPKQGFGVPIAAWLRGPLRSWADALLSAPRLREEGFFDEQTVSLKWREHRAGQRDWGLALWHVLMFQAWREHQAVTPPRRSEAAAAAPAPGERFEVCQP
ncbi:MAG TPA: asparagine synthase (glutamine-hydrolyzing) [Candidatus Paceibacterota bacterium]|nr:asparagine synthase (glutamine-hydrolyzing) [Verrucomicrobiota bacterium]HSA08820.1 asparagine synthase (glutamine-hydrolyzing) [Candidatus Paceibacterota bacterium]